jgi:hypothetical protein
MADRFTPAELEQLVSRTTPTEPHIVLALVQEIRFKNAVFAELVQWADAWAGFGSQVTMAYSSVREVLNLAAKGSSPTVSNAQTEKQKKIAELEAAIAALKDENEKTPVPESIEEALEEAPPTEAA